MFLQTWRDTTASYFNAFENEIDDGSYYVSTVVVGSTTTVENKYVL